jgi:hypothetical protein
MANKNKAIPASSVRQGMRRLINCSSQVGGDGGGGTDFFLAMTVKRNCFDLRFTALFGFAQAER